MTDFFRSSFVSFRNPQIGNKALVRLNHKLNLFLQAQFFEVKLGLLYMELPKKAYQHPLAMSAHLPYVD
ncbi:MAG: hypothetical protein AB8G05_12940 [Oligoflexales bacterium]